MTDLFPFTKAQVFPERGWVPGRTDLVAFTLPDGNWLCTSVPVELGTDEEKIRATLPMVREQYERLTAAKEDE